MRNTNGGEQMHKPLLEQEIKMTCRVSGQSRSAPEGVWVQEPRDKLIKLVPTTDNTTRKTSGTHPCHS